MSKAREPCNACQITLFASNRRSHHRDLLAVARAVAQLIENPWNDDRLGSAGVEHQPDLALRLSTRAPDPAFDKDQFFPRLEAGDLHGRMNRGIGPRRAPVQNDPIS